MNRFTFLLVLVLVFSIEGFAQTPLNPSRYSVANLPAASTMKNRVIVVSDGKGPGDCTFGGGTAQTWCTSDGSVWTPLGDGPGAATKSAKRRAVTLPGSTPNGLFSPAVVSGDLVFTSGHIGIDPKTGQLAEGGTAGQFEQVFKNLSAALEAAGSSTEHILKATVFLADMADYNTMNELYRKKFKGDPPARTTIQVAALPRGARIEIEAIAVRKD